VTITVVDQDSTHVYQPGLLFVPFGLSHAEDIVRPRARQLHAGIDYIECPVERVETAADKVVLSDGRELPYDVLVVATGVRLAPEETEGLLGEGWNDTMLTFYDLDGATRMAEKLDSFAGGRLVVNVVDMPIKCPVAPLEFCFLADWFFTQKGIRDQVDIIFATPLDGAFTKPVAAAALGNLLAEKGVELITEFNTGEADGVGRRLVGYDGREIPFDLAAIIPMHSGADYVGRSPGLGDDLNFVPTDPATLQSKAAPNVFALGDATNLPTSKAGSVTHFEGEVLTDNIVRFLEGRELDAGYDGHANCFIETGFGKALLIDFNYETEPLPGHFPTAVGMPLLKESRMNHFGKLMFQWMYWHGLLPGRDIPGIGAAMPSSGKHRTDAHHTDGHHNDTQEESV
jgi:sulfide:quinone oxidoreductase